MKVPKYFPIFAKKKKMDILNLDSVLETNGRYNGKTVRQIVENNRNEIMRLIKKGYNFGNDVLEAAHIKKSESAHVISNVICEHEKKSGKVYEKDTATMKEILHDINTIDRMIDDFKEGESENENEEIENDD